MATCNTKLNCLEGGKDGGKGWEGGKKEKVLSVVGCVLCLCAGGRRRAGGVCVW